uniref:Uncharacterized protein n=1 Tax=Arundo donax TaxID=35708 RepID=A0A0A9DS69_ARUDO
MRASKEFWMRCQKIQTQMEDEKSEWHGAGPGLWWQIAVSMCIEGGEERPMIILDQGRSRLLVQSYIVLKAPSLMLPLVSQRTSSSTSGGRFGCVSRATQQQWFTKS